MKTVEGGELTGKQLALIEPSEAPRFAARPAFATVNDGEHWAHPVLLLTDRRLIISKDKLIGKPKADFSADWADVSTVRGELWHGGPAMVQLMVKTRYASIELIVETLYAADVEAAVRSGYIDMR